MQVGMSRPRVLAIRGPGHCVIVWLPEVAGEVGLGAGAVAVGGRIKLEVADVRMGVVVVMVLVLVTLVGTTTGGAAMVVASMTTARAMSQVRDESLTIFVAFLF